MNKSGRAERERERERGADRDREIQRERERESLNQSINFILRRQWRRLEVLLHPALAHEGNYY